MRISITDQETDNTLILNNKVLITENIFILGAPGKGGVLWCHPRITQPNTVTEFPPQIEPIKLHSLYYSLQFHIH